MIKWNMRWLKLEKDRTHNGRFGASGAVSRGQGSAEMNVSGSWQWQCKPRLRQAAGTLCAILGKITKN